MKILELIFDHKSVKAEEEFIKKREKKLYSNGPFVKDIKKK